MKKIILGRGKEGFAIVGDSDFKRISKSKWHIRKRNHTSYVVRRQIVKGKKKTIYLHREILKLPNDYKIIDHIDGNGLNNQRRNLRVCTQSQNSMNRSLLSRNRSGNKGVGWYSRYNKWRARIVVLGKEKTLGFFKSKKEAIEAYRKASIKYHGRFANLKIKKPLVIG